MSDSAHRHGRCTAASTTEGVKNDYRFSGLASVLHCCGYICGAQTQSKFRRMVCRGVSLLVPLSRSCCSLPLTRRRTPPPRRASTRARKTYVLACRKPPSRLMTLFSPIAAGCTGGADDRLSGLALRAVACLAVSRPTLVVEIAPAVPAMTVLTLSIRDRRAPFYPPPRLFGGRDYGLKEQMFGAE